LNAEHRALRKGLRQHMTQRRKIVHVRAKAMKQQEALRSLRGVLNDEVLAQRNHPLLLNETP
jgi:hypothetical protein